jgi:hypothetical protein
MSPEQDRREQRGNDGHIWTRWSPVSEEAAHARQQAQDGNWEAAQTYALLAIGHHHALELAWTRSCAAVYPVRAAL